MIRRKYSIFLESGLPQLKWSSLLSHEKHKDDLFFSIWHRVVGTFFSFSCCCFWSFPVQCALTSMNMCSFPQKIMLMMRSSTFSPQLSHIPFTLQILWPSAFLYVVIFSYFAYLNVEPSALLWIKSMLPQCLTAFPQPVFVFSLHYLNWLLWKNSPRLAVEIKINLVDCSY